MAESKKAAETTKKVTVRLRRDPDPRHPQEEFYSYNFKNYIIKRGEEVEIPEGLAKGIENSEKAEEFAFLYAESKKLKED